MESLTKDLPVARGNGAPAGSVNAEITCLLDTIDLPIIVVGRDCTVARFNQAAEDALGLTMSDIGRRPCNIGALNEFRDIETLCAQVMADTAPLRREVRLGDRWFLLRLAPYTGSDAQSLGAVLTFSNVTGFRESIGQAIYEREYLKAILNTVNDTFVVLDKELRVQTGNRTFYEMFGISREAAQGVPLNNLGNDAWNALDVWPSLRAALLDNHDLRTAEVQRDVPSGGRRTLLLDACRLSPKGSTLVLLVLRDVTERKQAEEAVRASEQNHRNLALELERVNKQLAAFLETAAIALHRVAADGTILWANDAELQMLGYSREEYIGHHIAEFHADEPVITDILKRLTCGEKLHDYEARLRCKDGSIKTVLIDSSVLWEDGKFIHTQCFTRDITEKKNAEEALRESEERFRLATEAAKIGTFDWNIQTGINTWTPELEALYGLAPGEFGMTQASWEKLVHPDDRATAVAKVEEALATCAPTEHQWRVVWPDGSVHWIAGRFQCLRDQTGKPSRLTGVNINITEQKQAEQALRETNQRLTKVLEVETVGVMFWDLITGCLVDANDTFLKMTGYSRADVESRSLTWQKFTPPEYHDLSRVEVAKFMATGRVGPYEKEYFHKDGSRQWLLFAGSSLGNNQCVEFCVDISERKKIEQALRESEERYRATFENAAIGIAHVGLDGRWLRFNDAVCAITGYTRDELQRMTFTDITHPDDLDRDWQQAGQLIAGEIGRYSMEKRYIRRDGSTVWAMLTVSLMRDASGQPLHLVSVIENITEKVRSREILEQTVAQRTASLEQALAQMEDFTYSVSHDLRAPARTIRGFAQSAIEDYGDAIPPELRGFLDRISASAARMDQLIRDILDYSRISRAEVKLSTVQLDQLIHAIISERPDMQPDRARIHIRAPLHPVLAHEPSLAQAITNLLANAVKFVPPGAIPRVQLRTERNNNSVRLCITDNGIGVNPKYHHRLFNVFERAHDSPLYEGTGIGLAIVRKAAEKMGGKVGLVSDGLSGSSFWIELPAASL